MNPTNVVTPDQLLKVNEVLEKVFQGVLDFLYSIINILISFFTQPIVLGALATISVIYGAYRMLRKKSLS